jgi:hypothetical protein
VFPRTSESSTQLPLSTAWKPGTIEPSARLSLTSRFSCWPFTVSNVPPAKTDPPSGPAASVLTIPFASVGSNAGSTRPVAGSNAKMPVRWKTWPLGSITRVKLPPTTILPPISATAFTTPSSTAGVPVAGSFATMPGCAEFTAAAGGAPMSSASAAMAITRRAVPRFLRVASSTLVRAYLWFD